MATVADHRKSRDFYDHKKNLGNIRGIAIILFFHRSIHSRKSSGRGPDPARPVRDQPRRHSHLRKQRYNPPSHGAPQQADYQIHRMGTISVETYYHCPSCYTRFRPKGLALGHDTVLDDLGGGFSLLWSIMLCLMYTMNVCILPRRSNERGVFPIFWQNSGELLRQRHPESISC